MESHIHCTLYTNLSWPPGLCVGFATRSEPLYSPPSTYQGFSAGEQRQPCLFHPAGEPTHLHLSHPFCSCTISQAHCQKWHHLAVSTSFTTSYGGRQNVTRDVKMWLETCLSLVLHRYCIGYWCIGYRCISYIGQKYWYGTLPLKANWQPLHSVRKIILRGRHLQLKLCNTPTVWEHTWYSLSL